MMSTMFHICFLGIISMVIYHIEGTPSPIDISSSISCGETLTSSVEYGIIDYIEFHLDESTLVNFDTCYSDIDPTIFIYDINFNYLSSKYCDNDGDDCGVCSNSRYDVNDDYMGGAENFTMPLNNGTYYIAITPWDKCCYDDYTLTVNCFSSMFYHNYTTSCGENITNTIDKYGNDIYKLELDAYYSINFDTCYSEIDPTLVIYNSDGEDISSGTYCIGNYIGDDCGYCSIRKGIGGGENFSIPLMKPGTYYIEIHPCCDIDTHFRENDGGKYQIDMSCTKLHFPYQMVTVKGSFICDALTDNIKLIYDIKYDECLDICLYDYNDTDCVMVNYLSGTKTLSDSRCYIFDKQCDIYSNISNDNDDLIGLKVFIDECIDYPTDWTDKYDDNCYYYSYYKWCNTNNNTIDSNMNILSFLDNSDDIYKLNAIQTCCDCGGGLQLYDGIKLDLSLNFSRICDNWNHFEENREWNNINLYQLCIKLQTQIINNFEFIEFGLNTNNTDYIEMIDCNIFLDKSSSNMNANINICDEVIDDDIDLYFILIFKINSNGTFITYVNSNWFHIDTTLLYTNNIIINTMTYSECITSATANRNNMLFTVLPCDRLTESPSMEPTNEPTLQLSSTINTNPSGITTTSVFGNNSNNDHQSTIDTLTAFVVLLSIFILVCIYGMYRTAIKSKQDAEKIDKLETELQNIKSDDAVTMPLAPNTNDIDGIAALGLSFADHQCILCVERMPKMFNYPCGHVTYCSICSVTALNNNNKCPICRQTIKECKNIYSAGFK